MPDCGAPSAHESELYLAVFRPILKLQYEMHLFRLAIWARLLQHMNPREDYRWVSKAGYCRGPADRFSRRALKIFSLLVRDFKGGRDLECAFRCSERVVDLTARCIMHKENAMTSVERPQRRV